MYKNSPSLVFFFFTDNDDNSTDRHVQCDVCILCFFLIIIGFRGTADPTPRRKKAVTRVGARRARGRRDGRAGIPRPPGVTGEIPERRAAA